MSRRPGRLAKRSSVQPGRVTVQYRAISGRVVSMATGVATPVRLVHNQPTSGAMAQLGARLHGMQKVRGSSPLGSSDVSNAGAVSYGI